MRFSEWRYWSGSWGTPVAYNLILAENNTRFGDCLKKILEGKPGPRLVGEAKDHSGLLNLLKQTDSRLVLLSLSLLDLHLNSALSEIKRRYPNIKILIMGLHREAEYISSILAAGADGYLLKDEASEELVPAIETILGGRKYVPSSLKSTSPLHDDSDFRP